MKNKKSQRGLSRGFLTLLLIVVQHHSVPCICLITPPVSLRGTSADEDNPTSSPQKISSRLERGAQKAKDKLKKLSADSNGTLVVDANNVRGIAKFVKWNPSEIQQLITACSIKFDIPRTIIVWDHSNSKSAIPFFVSGGSNNQNQNECIILFSGLFQRADDVIVEEAQQLSSSSSLYATNTNSNGDTTRSEGRLESLGFVTNDGGLIGRLLQNENKKYFRLNNKDKSRESEDNSSKDCVASRDCARPMMIDSTSFVEILSSIEEENEEILDNIESSGGTEMVVVDLAMKDTIESLRRFATTKTRQGWNPRREKTWERCILAENLRQSMCQQGEQELLVHNTARRRSSFTTDYLRKLKERGYLGVEEIIQQQEELSSSSEIGGPTRLDKKQRRLLGRYNAFRKKERNTIL